MQPAKILLHENEFIDIICIPHKSHMSYLFFSFLKIKFFIYLFIYLKLYVQYLT